MSSPPIEDSRLPSCTSEGESMAARCVSSLEQISESALPGSNDSIKSSPDALNTFMNEMFISEENLNKMENVLDTWSTHLKSNVMMELRKWKLSFVEQHRLELKKASEKHAAEMKSLKELNHTYKISNQRKDEVIENLSGAIDSQREKLELMRTFSHWRLQQCVTREEIQGSKHYNLQLKRKVWAAWKAVVQKKWQDRVEKACCARAEDVCMQLSEEYETKMVQNVEELQKAQAEIHRLRSERDRYESSMKKAFMRGVCALNIEALSMFSGGETSRSDHDVPPSREEPNFSSLASRPPRTVASSLHTPTVKETPVQMPTSSHRNADDVTTVQYIPRPVSRHDSRVFSTPALNSSIPPEGTFGQGNLQKITAAKQKASKTITARFTGRSEPNRVGRPPMGLQVMGVAPPMSSIVVERHHPVTQLTVGQATAVKYPAPALQSQAVSSSKSSSNLPRGSVNLVD